MYIIRKIEHTILEHLKDPEIIAVVGPRQAGKTTMIRHLLADIPGARILSFDDRTVLELFEQSPDDFYTTYMKGVPILCIDEFQYASEGGKVLKYILDRYHPKIIISGSSSPELAIRALKYLVGRIFIYTLYPFDFEEFLSARDLDAKKMYTEYHAKASLSAPSFLSLPQSIRKKLARYYEEFLIYGGYPRVVLAEDSESKKEVLRNIYNTFFLREIKDFLGLIDDYKMNALMKALALQIGNIIEYNELSQVSGFSHVALKKYLNFLEKTHICVFSRPFFRNRRLEIVKSPKVYFCDTGLRNEAASDYRPIDSRPDAGAVLENVLASQLIKQKIPLRFWRSKQKHEMDFVVDLSNGQISSLEVKKRLPEGLSVSVHAFQKAYPEYPVVHAYYVEAKSDTAFPAYPLYLL